LVLTLTFIPNGSGRLLVRRDVRDVVAGVKQGLDLAVENPGVGGVVHDRADDDVHVDASLGAYSG
jgi:hypothetical protein